MVKAIGYKDMFYTDVKKKKEVPVWKRSPRGKRDYIRERYPPFYDFLKELSWNTGMNTNVKVLNMLLHQRPEFLPLFAKVCKELRVTGIKGLLYIFNEDPQKTNFWTINELARTRYVDHNTVYISDESGRYTSYTGGGVDMTQQSLTPDESFPANPEGVTLSNTVIRSERERLMREEQRYRDRIEAVQEYFRNVSGNGNI